MQLRLLALAAVALAAGLPSATAGRALHPPSALPPGFSQIGQGPAGGTVWTGLIPDPGVPALDRPSVIYLPPGFPADAPYTVVYFLQGFAGSPYQYVDGVNLPSIADAQIAGDEIRPFIGVVPPAGLDSRHGDWTGIWENYLVNDVVPWAAAHLPGVHGYRGRVLAGLSAGGYGAVDIGLRHPRLAQTLEAWSGYFEPLRAGALVHAGRRQWLAHDPTWLVHKEAPLFHSLGTRFFLSSGTTHDRVTARATRAFARELAALGLPYSLWLGRGGHDGRLWRAQLPAALRYALAPFSGRIAR